MTISFGAGCYREWQLGCRWYTATTTVLMRGLYPVSDRRTSGNWGTISAPVSAEIPKIQKQPTYWPKVEISLRSQVSGIADRPGLGRELRRIEKLPSTAARAGRSAESSISISAVSRLGHAGTRAMTVAIGASTTSFSCNSRYLTLQIASDSRS